MNAPSIESYRRLYDGFHWHVPAEFNIADLCCTRWADEPDRVAILHEDESGKSGSLTFGALEDGVNRLANALRALGVERGDRVAIILAQRPETAIANFACYRLGAVAMPLSILFGPDALEYRLVNSEAKVAIVDDSGIENLTSIRERCHALRHVIGIDCAGDGHLRWDDQLASGAATFAPVGTKADEPAILIYTSGTTGSPKGALLPQSIAIGNLPGFVASHNWFPKPGAVFWSPADWAWTGGLIDALIPSLYFGVPIVAYRGRFTPERAFQLMEKYGVTNTFLFPTALKMMAKSVPKPLLTYGLKLRSIMSAGEAVGAGVFHWAKAELGVTINEMFGQTELNYIVGNSAEQWPAKPGSIGFPYPGHRVAVLNDEGTPVGPGEIGDVALHRTDIHGDPDPIFFLRYWANPDATAQKFSGDWCRTGDLAEVDDDGYFWYRGRADDMFKAAGYRIGPSEVENCLIGHPTVVNAAVVPKPDVERGNLVKAYVVLAPGISRDPADASRLVADLQAHVRGKLAPYEYPKEIEFVDELPMTTTGKVMRRVLRQREEERASRG